MKGAPDRQKLAETPHLFREIFNPKSAIVVPVVSSENRRYIPIDYIDDNFICTDRVKLILNVEIFHFGILRSSVHNTWMRAVCGRLEMRYNYSKIQKILFIIIFLSVSRMKNKKKKISETAQNILNVRKNYQTSTLDELYDDILMPKDLRNVHKENDFYTFFKILTTGKLCH